MKNKITKIFLRIFLIFISLSAILYYSLYYVEYDSKINIISDNKSTKVRIAVLDSGYSIIENKKIKHIKINDFDTGIDKLGHGTKVINIIAELNPYAEIFSIKVLDDAGSGNKRNIYEALKWCLKHRIDIINLSFSMPKDDKVLKKILKELDLIGTIIVSSYDNINKISYPASYKFVFGVKAHDRWLRKNEIFIKENIMQAYGGEKNKKNGKYNSYAAARVTAYFSRKIKNKEFIRRKINEY